jgi:DNA-binding transcriptional LysR family regulator
MPSVSGVLLPGLIARVARRHPAIELAVIDGHDDEVVEWVPTGTVDVAVVADEHAGLIQQPLVTGELLAVLPSTHRLAQAAAADRRELTGEPFILTRAGCEKLVLAALRTWATYTTCSTRSARSSSILALVSEGFGVSVMPRLAASRVPHKVALRPLRPHRGAAAVARDGDQASPGARHPCLPHRGGEMDVPSRRVS